MNGHLQLKILTENPLFHGGMRNFLLQITTENHLGETWNFSGKLESVLKKLKSFLITSEIIDLGQSKQINSFKRL